MKHYRLFLLAALSVAAIVATPTVSQAQCVEKCALIKDGDSGQYIGHGCLSGNEGNGCVATVWDCTINRAGCGGDMLFDAPVLDEDGQQLATAKVCSAAKQVVELKLIEPVERGRSVMLPKTVANGELPK